MWPSTPDKVLSLSSKHALFITICSFMTSIKFCFLKLIPGSLNLTMMAKSQKTRRQREIESNKLVCAFKPCDNLLICYRMHCMNHWINNITFKLEVLMTDLGRIQIFFWHLTRREIKLTWINLTTCRKFKANNNKKTCLSLKLNNRSSWNSWNIRLDQEFFQSMWKEQSSLRGKNWIINTCCAMFRAWS